jgi:hypothetical protein
MDEDNPLGFYKRGNATLGGLFHFCKTVFFEERPQGGLNTWKNADIWQVPSVVSVSDVCAHDANISMKSPSSLHIEDLGLLR